MKLRNSQGMHHPEVGSRGLTQKDNVVLTVAGCRAIAHALVAGLLALAATAGAPLAAAGQTYGDCAATPTIHPGTTLAELADQFFADLDYRHAILLATNTRSGEGFPFIGNPNRLPVGKQVCVPVLAEAERLKKRFESYLDAVGDMALAEPSEVTDKLDVIDISRPAVAISWVRADQAKGYEAQIGKTVPAGGATWVTIAPHLQEFCQGFVSTDGDDPALLTLRLEQRLGLPPHSAKTHFVELEVANPGNPLEIFRPCVSPDVTAKSCTLGPPSACPSGAEAESCHAHRDFFMNQYYSSYGVSLPTEYPWTSLGYTFDWAHGPIGLHGDAGFVQYGESEYVIAKGAQVTVKRVVATADYCNPGR